MATCPKCLGPLTENHKCPSGIGRRLTDAVITVGVGGGIGAALAFAVNDRPPTSLVLAAAALGAVLANAVRQAVGGKL